MDLNVFWGLVEPSGVEATDQDDRLERLAAAQPAGQRWDFADPAELSARVPRWGALFGKVA